MITNLNEKHNPQPVARATALGYFAEAIAMRSAKLLWVAAIALTLLFGASRPATAQTATSGVVLGKVTDPSGAVVVGAEVTLTDNATNRVLTQQSNAEGHFTFVNVLPGLYTLRVSSQGFRTASLSEVNVEVNKSFTADIALEIGDTASTVEVTAGVGTEIQTTDAQVGNVIGERMIRNLPTLQRNAIELLSLQPATTPGGFGTGGTVSGARSDQNTLILDGIDVSDNLTGGQGADFTQAPVGVDAVSEFRVTVTNPNATFGRSSGGQMTISSPRGSNELHGVAYWYHQNDNLNANTWTNNRSDIPKGELKDNRGGFSVGGPVWRDKTFFFGNYEVRRFPQVNSFTRTVPTNSLRNGILTFTDEDGNNVAYPLATSTACGATGGSACDPRGLGVSPTVQEMFALMPAGNETGGDGLNTTGFRGMVSTPVTSDEVTFRLDHSISSKLQFMGRYGYRRNLAPVGGNSQLDIRDTSNVIPLRANNERGRNVIAGLDYQITPNWINSFRFGWIQNNTDLVGTSPSIVASMLALPGTNSSAGGVGIELAQMSEPIGVAAQNARTQILQDRNIQFSNNTTWVKGSHTVNFGGDVRALPFLFLHDDQVTFMTGPVANLGVGFLTIPEANRPPSCNLDPMVGPVVTSSCIRSGEEATWDALYAATLGLVDNVNVVGARDGDLNPLPLGSNLDSDTNVRTYQFHFQDTWRVRPNLTFTYGLTYGWVSPLTEKLDRIALVTDSTTGEVFSARSYMRAREEAALQGQIFNPEIGFRPINDSVRDSLFDTDYSNFGPRVSLAWSPSFQDGFLGKLTSRRTVVRTGFGIVHDRVNTISVLVNAAFSTGFAQVLQTLAPLCDVSGTPGAGCNPGAGAANAGLSAFRLGHDGDLPIPPFTGGASPIVPPPFAGGQTIATDPNRRVGRNYVVDLTIQRELPGNLVAEVGYIGRLGRELPIGVDLSTSPIFFVDPGSGQSFAQAYDNVACVLQGSAGLTFGSFTCPNSVQPQPWFENQLMGLGGTAFVTGPLGSLVRTNNVSVLFLLMNQFRVQVLGQPSFNNVQSLFSVLASSGGISNYHAMFATVRNRPWNGLQFDVNYTLSKSLDQAGNVQNNLSLISNGFRLNTDYGPAQSDRRHVLNGIFNYDLPFGAGRRWSSGRGWLNNVIGGWYFSGIYRAYTSLPLFVTDNAGVFGTLVSPNNNAIPLRPPDSLDPGIYAGVAGSSGVGTIGNPVNNGSGLNLFTNPENAFNSFRRILLTQDGRGRGNEFRGPGFWNLDFRVGKETKITERVSFQFSFDFFNVFNHVNFSTPSLSLNNRAAFGVFSSQLTPPNRSDGARWIQFGSRISF